MYQIIKSDNDIAYGIKEFVCDTEKDLALLPNCAMGSTAIVIETATVYIKNSKNKWVKLDGTSGNKPNILSNDEFLQLCIDTDMLPSVTDENQAFLADENGNILLW